MSESEEEDQADMISFMAHPENLLSIPDVEDPLERFIAVVAYYLSGWHIKPPYETSIYKEEADRRQRSKETTQSNTW